MTFEEFLIKKKIDPVQFKSGEKLLFLEFESHFSQMGEKSFDHSKKFLFNKLRRAHPLKEEPKLEKPVELAAQKTETNKAIDVEVSGSAIKPTDSESKTTYKPRFKATVGPTKDEPLVQSEEQTQKPTFKPRFRAGVTSVPKDAENTEEEVVKESEMEVEPTKPSAYIPRFKPSMAVKEVTSEESKSSEEYKEDEIEQPKPAYKPRFNPSIIKKNKE